MASDVPAGTIMVLDALGGTNEQGALYRIDPVTHARTLVSDFGNPSQGPMGQVPTALAFQVDALGLNSSVLVADEAAGSGGYGAIFKVDPVSGQRQIVSNFGDIGQGLGDTPSSVLGTSPLLGLAPQVWTTDPDFGGKEEGALFNVSVNGQRTIKSDFNNAGQGPEGYYAEDLAVLPDGGILVADSLAGTNSQGTLYRVDQSTGSRSLVTEFGDPTQGPTGNNPVSVTVVSGLLGLNDTAVVLDDDNGTNFAGMLFSVDPTTGERTVLSDLGDDAEGPVGVLPVAVAYSPGLLGVGLNPSLILLDAEAGKDYAGALFSVDPVTGQRSLLEDLGDGHGPIGVAVTDVAVR